MARMFSARSSTSRFSVRMKPKTSKLPPLVFLRSTMLSRFISKPSRFLPLLNFVSSQTHHTCSKPVAGISLLSKSGTDFYPKSRDFYLYSTKGGNGNSGDADSTTSTSGLWKIYSEIDRSVESVFGEDDAGLEGLHDGNGDAIRSRGEDKINGGFARAAADNHNVGGRARDTSFSGGKEELSGGGGEAWAAAEDYEPWSFGGEEMEGEDKDLLEAELEGRRMGLSGLGHNADEELGDSEKSEKTLQLESEEKELIAVLKGPNRAFGDLIASSGITDEMLDSLIALQDFEGIQGLPPLSEIEERRYEKNSQKTHSRADIERTKQEEVAKARVRQVDDKGRAYATGRRKCSIARVWIQPGEGRFIVNDKEFDVYFPMLDHRAILLRPFTETKTLGMWDVNCTVKGGGTSGQVGAIRLGISKALQNWEPGFRPPLKAAGFLTRDSRVVERKKPGKAKARKSFQWVKR